MKLRKVNKKVKKGLIISLCVCIVLGFFSGSVMAGTPQTSNTYQINTPDLSEVEVGTTMMSVPISIVQTAGVENSPVSKIRVQVTNKPEGASVEFNQVNPGDGSTLNVIDNDYSSTGSFVIPANTNHTDLFNIRFSVVGDYTILYSLVDLNEANPYIVSKTIEISVVSQLSAPLVNTPDANGNATVNNTKPEVVITSPTQSVILTVTSGTTNPTINFSSLVSSGAGILPEFTINSSLATISIQGSTAATSTGNSWNGIMDAPSISNVTIPSVAGFTTTLERAFKLGSSNTKLSFDKAIKITFPSQAAKLAGYFDNNSTFTEITDICAGDSMPMGNALAVDGNCKIDVGSDLVVWTKHFTTFVVYSLTAVDVPVEELANLRGHRNSSSTPPIVSTSTPAQTPADPATSTPVTVVPDENGNSTSTPQTDNSTSTSTPQTDTATSTATTTNPIASEVGTTSDQTASLGFATPVSEIILGIIVLLGVAAIGFKLWNK